MLRMVVSRTLYDQPHNKSAKAAMYTLLGVIGSIGEDPKVETSGNAIAAHDDNTILICIHELVI